MNCNSIIAGCVLALLFYPAQAQTMRFKPLAESEMSEAQLKAARELASGPRGQLEPGRAQCLAAAQSRPHVPHAKGGRVSALQQLAAAAAE